jgi:hypothetical protein
MRKFLTVLLVAATAIVSPLAAQSHPDFTGTWIIDAKAAPAGITSMTMTVKQDPKTINVVTDINTTMGAQKVTNVFNLDGSESKNSMSGPAGTIETTSTVAWEGAVMVVATKASVQGQEISQNDKWSLGADGKTLNLERAVGFGGQNMSTKLAFNKQ